MGNPRIVDQHINVVKVRKSLSDHFFDKTEICHVSLETKDICGTGTAQGCCKLFQSVVAVATAESQIISVFGKAFCKGGAYAVGGSGNQNNFSHKLPHFLLDKE
jgi:hypothetical protein